MEDWDTKIQAYMDGELKPEEVQAFEQKVADTPALSQRLKEYQDTILQLESVQLAEFRSEMKSWIAEAEKKTKVRPIYWAAAAAIILLLILVGSRSYLDQVYSDDKLLSSNMDYRVDEADRGDGTLRGTLDLVNLDFEKAIQTLPKWQEEGKIVPKSYLYLAKAHIGLAQYDSALYYLNLLDRRYQTEPTAVLFWQEIPWYQALAALGKGNTEMALKQLDIVINNKGYHQTDAKKLKAKIESIWYPLFNE